MLPARFKGKMQGMKTALMLCHCIHHKMMKGKEVRNALL